MSISITVGKARIFPINALMSDGSQNTTLTPGINSTADSSKLVVRINPTNNREVGMRAAAPGAVFDVAVILGSLSTPTVQVQPVAPTLVSVSLGTDGGEVDPPSWLL